jgi:hypothetical protein
MGLEPSGKRVCSYAEGGGLRPIKRSNTSSKCRLASGYSATSRLVTSLRLS